MLSTIRGFVRESISTKQRTHTLIAGGYPHNNNVLGELFVWIGVDQLHDFVVDDAGIWIVDGTVSANQKLWVLVLVQIASFLPKQFAELGVGVDDVGDTWQKHEMGPW